MMPLTKYLTYKITPHSIERQKNDEGIVIDARTEDWRDIHPIGAKMVKSIFAEVGHQIPATDETELEIVFSAYKGEVVAIQPKDIVQYRFQLFYILGFRNSNQYI